MQHPVTDTCFLFQEIKAVGTELGITPLIIRGEELKQKGFGGTCVFRYLSVIGVDDTNSPVRITDLI